MEIFGFVTLAHAEIFVHFWVLLADALAFFVGQVGDDSGVHFEGSLDGRLLYEGLSLRGVTSSAYSATISRLSESGYYSSTLTYSLHYFRYFSEWKGEY